MPDLENWNPTAAANMFGVKKARRESAATTSAGAKSREQPYFKGIFSGARNHAEETEDKENISNKTFDI